MISLNDNSPNVAASAWLAPTATLIGAVTVGPGVSVWYGAVLRADTCTISIGEGAVVEDNVVIHGGADSPVSIGSSTIVGHGCVIHGARIGQGVLVGSSAVILEGCEIGDRAIIGAGTVMPPRTRIPPNTLVTGNPAGAPVPIRPGSRLAGRVGDGVQLYRDLARHHAAATDQTGTPATPSP